MSDIEVVPPELEDLANEVGDFICYWGFKKVHGRAWTHLYLSSEPLDAGQLVQRLKVSKALVSITLNDLMQYDVILEHGKSERGTQTYVANPEVHDVILNVLRRRERKMLSRAETSHRMLALLSKDKIQRARLQPTRVDALGQMIVQAQNALASILELATVDMAAWENITEKK